MTLALAGFTVSTPAVAQTEIRFAEQFGLLYLPMQVVIAEKLVEKHAARDTTHREPGAGLAELSVMTRRHSQHHPGHEIPEANWAYRFAKKHWFFGFGAYS